MAKCCAPPACQPPARPGPPIAQPGRSRLRQDRVVLPPPDAHTPCGSSISTLVLAAAPAQFLRQAYTTTLHSLGDVLTTPGNFFTPAGPSAAAVVVMVCDLPSRLMTHTSQCHPVLQTPLPVLPSLPSDHGYSLLALRLHPHSSAGGRPGRLLHLVHSIVLVVVVVVVVVVVEVL